MKQLKFAGDSSALPSASILLTVQVMIMQPSPKVLPVNHIRTGFAFSTPC